MTRPGVGMPFCDDFSYILSALRLEQTGHTVYNGWAAPSLGWLMFYGALVIRLFGFSFPHLHAAMVPVGMGCAVLLHRIYARLGLRNTDAVFATLSIVLSLIFVPLTFSFMTDIPGLFVFLLCFYLCLRAFAARTPRIACGWVLVAIVTNAIGGTVRQSEWVGLFAMVPVALWHFRRQREVWVPAGVAWLASLAYVRYYMHWFSQQPYSLRESFIATMPTGPQAVHNVLQAMLIMGLFLLPVTIAFLLPQRTRTLIALGASVSACGITLLLARHAPLWIVPFGSEWINIAGLVIPSVIGWRPVVLTPPICLFLTMLTLATLFAVVATLLPGIRVASLRRVVISPSTMLFVVTFLMTALLTFSRSTTWSRYYISMLVLLVPALLHLYRAGTSSTRLPWVCGAVLAIFTAFTIVACHDEYAVERARLAAANRLIEHGIPRDRFWGGFEYDGWTQIVKTGYLNEGRMGPPTAFYRVPPKLPDPAECNSWFADYTPDIHPVAELAFEPITGCGAELPGVEPIHYRTWFAPRDRAIYLLAWPAAQPAARPRR